ncbi:MAG: hypothetical protein IPI45_11805 [Saprospiraceae bacterium]|nr:hypothetical protein [Saprospiraceae bacterium]MBK7360495.1 hypothetical protein [Saprospiraceae bacterium]MBK7738448.1 hypothetical protein [Saprospiraceae bacterium]MBK7912981.1 hypothetical protein [Saprospiraceae bacterium]
MKKEEKPRMHELRTNEEVGVATNARIKDELKKIGVATNARIKDELKK